MIPGGSITPQAITNTFKTPNDLPYTPLTQTVWGGKAIGDASLGRLLKYWIIFYASGVISVKPSDGPIAFTLEVPDVLTVSLAFDNNMGLAICYTKIDGAYFYYFDSLTNRYATRSFVGVTSARVCVDDARDFYLAQSDIIFAYTLNGKLYYRQQRDRYDVEYLVGVTSSRLIRVGQSITNRLQFELGVNLNTAPPTPLTQPRITNIQGTLYPLNKPTLTSVEGTPDVVGIPRLASIYGNIYLLGQPTIISIEGFDVPLRTPNLISLEGQTYSLDKPNISSIEGQVPLVKPTLVSIEGATYPLTIPQPVSFEGTLSVVKPVMISFEGTPVPLNKPIINSLEGNVVIISRPNLITIDGILVSNTGTQTDKNDLFFTELPLVNNDLFFFDPAIQ